MNTMDSPGAVPKTSNRFLWLAIAGFAGTSLALATALVQVNRQAEPVKTAEAQTQLVAKAEEPVSRPSTKVTPDAGAKLAQAPSVHKAKAHTSATPAHSSTEVVREPSSSVVACANCGTVEAVTPLQRDAAQGSGAGVVAGAVLGGLVGNQFGGGDGKTLATIAGAVGGGYAGNAVEKKMKKVTVYQVEVRMANGTTRMFEQSSPATVGAQVKVEGNALRPA